MKKTSEKEKGGEIHQNITSLITDLLTESQHQKFKVNKTKVQSKIATMGRSDGNPENKLRGYKA